MAEVRIAEADLSDREQGAAIVAMIDDYARGPMGGGRPLREDVQGRLAQGLAGHPMARVWLAWDDSRPVGVAVVFEGYSTFAAAPSFNVHDLAVRESHQGQGIGRRLLAAVEHAARGRGCCKLTLEVLEENVRAQGLYRSVGFVGGAPAESGQTFFLSKTLER